MKEFKTYIPIKREEQQPAPTGLLHWLHLDASLLLGLICAASFGLFVLYSAGRQDIHLVSRQAMRLALGFAVMLVVAWIPPHTLKRVSPWIYGIGFILLIIVELRGDVSKGAQRWLDLGFVRFQPSEIMKFAVPMAAAWFLTKRPLPSSFWSSITALLIILVPVGLIMHQPDLGTALLVLFAGISVIFLAGIRWRYILLSLLALILMAVPFWHYGMHEYQRQRVITMFNPESDPLHHGYHIIQSKIAIGAGGLWGKGYMNGTQTRLEFLPESSTDFIFAVMAEEFGLYRMLLVLGLYFLIVARIFWLCVKSTDTFCRLVSGAISLSFFFYVFINTGMVSGILPVVGVPLPFMSYGGTSIVVIMACFGIVMSMSTHPEPIESNILMK